MTDFDPLIRQATGPVDPQRVPVRRKRRRHPAAGARVIAAGLGASTMFGLVATMGIASAAANSAQGTSSAAPAAVVPAPISLTAPAAVAPATIPPVTSPAGTVQAAAPSAPVAPSGPIVLQARPDVRVVTPAPAAPAPAAVTSGSA